MVKCPWKPGQGVDRAVDHRSVSPLACPSPLLAPTRPYSAVGTKKKTSRSSIKIWSVEIRCRDTPSPNLIWGIDLVMCEWDKVQFI